jgi:hypothetical protein
MCLSQAKAAKPRASARKITARARSMSVTDIYLWLSTNSLAVSCRKPEIV